MTAGELVSRLRNENVELWLDGDRLRFRAPEGALTAAWREAIAARRGEIIAALRSPTGRSQRCESCLPANWIDGPPSSGRIRTTCRICGRFIGYRPAA